MTSATTGQDTMHQKLKTALATLEREGHREVAQVLRQLVEAHTVETWNAALVASSTWIRDNAQEAPSFYHLTRGAMLGAVGLFLSTGMETKLRRFYQEQVPPQAGD